ncbi:hypothetical protein JCM10908_003919 [Rhodotorula pacifica]|uniref:uncharacterized protein n=1 Tax=Rhodotorula pacifica TaxID=1495444 RepID=UPI003180A942
MAIPHAFPRWALAVDTALSALSVVGGLAIIIGYLCAPQKQHLRLKLILGLGVTDFVQATTTLVGTGLSLSGHPYRPDTSSCLASSFVYQASVICNACWTLAITLVTYLTLLHPLSKATGFLDSVYAFPLIAGICVGLAIAPAIVLTIVYRMEDSAGICWLPATSLAAKLELFIPRASVLVLVIVLYARMFVFFRRRDMHLLDTESTSHGVDSQHPRQNRFSLGRLTSASRSQDQSRRASHVSSQHEPKATTAPARRLSPIPASPAPDAANGAEEDSDGSDPSTQPRKDSATTVSFSDHEYGTSALDFSPSARTVNPNQVRISIGAGADSTPVPRLLKYNASTPPLSATVPNNNPPRNVGLSPRQLNKRLSLLMACYPIAYAALVAVSLARLIQQFVTGGRTNPGLLYASRFLIFSQGAVDGILYFAIQAAFKFWNRKGRPGP